MAEEKGLASWEFESMYTLMLEHDPDIFDILLMACKSQDAAQ